MRVGSLFSGYGGLDLAVGGDLQWYSEIEPAACTVLEAHHPGVQNLGDITQVDWSTVPPVDIITGGYPCQPFSQAGRRKGKNDERHLWPFVWDAIRTMGPRHAILENVRGHLSLGFADVLADLASIGWNAEWAVVPASAVGACHRRERIFIVAYASDTSGAERRTAQHEYLRKASESATESGERAGVVADTEITGSRINGSGLRQECVGSGDGQTSAWREYERAIRRWEHILGRAAPNPTIMGSMNRPQLNPVFVEWMMGLPEGHVTGHGLSAHKCLKMLGNGVVPQQANYAITQLFARIS